MQLLLCRGRACKVCNFVFCSVLGLCRSHLYFLVTALRCYNLTLQALFVWSCSSADLKSDLNAPEHWEFLKTC